MARFDVFRSRSNGPLPLDCQADLVGDLATRFVVPLLPEADVPRPMARLNPTFAIDGHRFVMAPHLAAAIPSRELGERVVALIDRQDEMAAALDMLVVGF